jgi:hypothetical protein
LEFVNIVIDYLTERVTMDPRLLYESPFTDLDPLGVAGVFKEGEVVQLIQILRDVQERAASRLVQIWLSISLPARASLRKGNAALPEATPAGPPVFFTNDACGTHGHQPASERQGGTA